MSKVTRQARKHNDEMRNVSYVHTYNFRDLLEHAEGNMLINGGTKEKRRNALTEYIAHMSRNTKRPIIIFSDDFRLEKELIECAKQGVIGELKICSEDYLKYDFFRGMKDARICECFCDIALATGAEDTKDVYNYTHAFLSVMKNVYPVRYLAAMLDFASRGDDEIVKNTSVGADIDCLRASVGGGITFRTLLKIFEQETDAVSNKEENTGKDSNGICLEEIIKEPVILLIKSPVENYKILASYFAQELTGIINKDFVCVFDDSVMLNTESIQTVVSAMKQRQNIDVIISCENIVALDEVRDNSILVNFNQSVIFLKGNAPHQDLQKVLSVFGQYNHMEVTVNKGRNVFDIIDHNNTEAVQLYAKDRVLLQEEENQDAVVACGGNPRLVITANFQCN